MENIKPISITSNNVDGMLLLDGVEKQLQDYAKLYLDASHKRSSRSRVNAKQGDEYRAKAYKIMRTLDQLRKFRNDWMLQHE